MKRPEGPRLAGGTARGAVLHGVPGTDVRPATARMRQSVFEILRPRLEGARVVDLFAGTGCLGLEALSRGAARAIFLDVDDRALEAVGLNLKKLRFEDRGEVRRADAFRAGAELAKADLVFIDPPYRFFVERRDALLALLGAVAARVLDGPGARAIVEHRPGEGLGEVAGAVLADSRSYGGTHVTFYAPAAAPPNA